MADCIALPGYGRLELGDEDLVFVPFSGPARRLGARRLLRREDGPLVAALAESGHQLMVGRRTGDALYCFDARRDRLQTVAIGERLPGAEALQIAAAGDLFVAVTENGILGVESEGRERWRIARVSYGWRFEGRSGDSVFLSDTAGNLLAFDAASGEEVP